LATEVARRCPEVEHVAWGVTTRVADTALPEQVEQLVGEELMNDQIGPLSIEVRPMSFVQPNLTQAARVYQALITAANFKGTEVVYDFYCGIGSIALMVAPHVQSVIGIELDPDNTELALSNAKANGLVNVTFHCGKVEDLVARRGLFERGLKPDVVILDPPRAGLHPEVMGPLLQAGASQLIYLSCNPASLARDLKVILEREPTYQIRQIQLFDFFPQTAHMEVLVVLGRSC